MNHSNNSGNLKTFEKSSIDIPAYEYGQMCHDRIYSG